MNEPPTSGDFHVFFRGLSRSLGTLEYDDVFSMINDVVWEMGVGETDRDPLFLFEAYDLVTVYRMVHTSRGYNTEAGEVIEYRVFNVFDEVGGLIETITLNRMRGIEEGEVP